jgi:hypothetical protein
VKEVDRGSEEFRGDLNRPLGELLRELHESRQEIARLRAENHDLRSKLGFDSPRAISDNELPSSLPRSAIYTHSALEDKIALLRSLFRGRDDVYAIRWTSTKTGNTGYSPAVRGGWAAAKSRPKSFLPLTDEVIEGHLTGDTSIGIYPLLKDDTCRFLACDFDGDGWPLDAGAYIAAAEGHGVSAVSSDLVPARGDTFGSSSLPRCPQLRPGVSGPGFCARRWWNGARSTSKATTASFPVRTSCPRAASGT